MQKKSDNQLALFIRDEQSGRLAFNAQALRALGVDPAEARETDVTIGVMHAQCLKETTCNNASLLFCKLFHREPLSDTVSLQARGRANLRR